MNVKRNVERRTAQGGFSVLEHIHQNFANPHNAQFGTHRVTPSLRQTSAEAFWQT
jgi:hypothetical protein